MVTGDDRLSRPPISEKQPPVTGAGHQSPESAMVELTIGRRRMGWKGSLGFEQERKHIATGIECYMRQHGVSEREVCDEFDKDFSASPAKNSNLLNQSSRPCKISQSKMEAGRLFNLMDNKTNFVETSQPFKSCVLFFNFSCFTPFLLAEGPI
ncbi:Pinene synthase [Morus notabilis]|uniref:Pinene synthase n=1 Tax=Morus notabilis TaxID=981085 RepID=W9QQN3_9ROSA|nr:Pinene synthase [Morus notabilis]